MIFSTSKKIVDFWFPARLIDAVPCTEILCLRTPYFHYGRAPRPRARCPGGTLHVFHYFHHCFCPYFSRNLSPICMNVKKHTDLPSFFRPRLPVKTMCSIDAYDENLKFWKPAKSEFWGVQNWTWRTDPRPLPCSCLHEQGRGLSIFATGGGALVRVQVDDGCRDMFARAPNHMWSRFMCFSSKK